MIYVYILKKKKIFTYIWGSELAANFPHLVAGFQEGFLKLAKFLIFQKRNKSETFPRKLNTSSEIYGSSPGT